MAYDVVHIVNSTRYHAAGEVEYVSDFCSDDRYYIKPHDAWYASSRGYCLVKKITARLGLNGENYVATAYTSSGTSFSEFAIIQTGPGTFEVIRRVTGTHDTPPPDHVEPTEPQK